MATYVLVPGGWDGAWQWRPIARLPQAPSANIAYMEIETELGGLGRGLVHAAK